MRKNFFFILWCLLLFVLLLVFPAAAIHSAQNALRVWATAVVPSLMPFSIATGLLGACGITDLIAKVSQKSSKKLFGFSGEFPYAFLASALSGYPMGAKVTADLYKRGKLTLREASAFINCTSTSGPMFIIGTVSIGMLSSRAFAPYLLYAHYLSVILLAVFAGRPFRRQPRAGKGSASEAILLDTPQDQSFGAVLSSAVQSAIQGMLSICGFILLYGVFTGCLEQIVLAIGNTRIRHLITLLSGLFEMTTGSLNSSFLPVRLRLVFISGLLSFGGLSIHSQTRAIAAQNGIPLKNFFLHKSIQGLLSAGITFILTELFPLDTETFSYSNPRTGIPLAVFLFLCAALCIGASIWYRYRKHTGHNKPLS